MAISIDTNIAELVFSSQVPDIVVSTTSSSFRVEVGADGAYLLDETFYTYGGSATVRDLRSLIERHCEKLHTAMCRVQVLVSTDNNDEDELNFDVIYCTSIPPQTAMMFAEANFLTTLSARLMPRNEMAVDYLWAYSAEDSTENAVWSIACASGGSVTTVECQQQLTLEAGINRLPVRYEAVRGMAEEEMDGDFAVLGFGVKLGDRIAEYFVTDNAPSALFLFDNTFGCKELALLVGETIGKTSSERPVAVINGKGSFYDRRDTKEYAFESAHLMEPQARWLAQMLTSRDVRFVGNYTELEEDDLTAPPEVLITEYKCELSDTDAEPNTIGFTWKFADERPRLES